MADGDEAQSQPAAEAEMKKVFVSPADYQYAYAYGGEQILFTKDEIAQMKSLGESGLQLVGFKPLAALKAYENMRPSYYLYPDEDVIKGSVTAYTALLSQMLAKGRMALCRFKGRAASPLKMVALIPHAEELDAEGFQVTPPGFSVILLPYADDIRNVPRTPVPAEGNTAVGMMKNVISGIALPTFDPMAYPNPVIRRHQAVLEATVMEVELPEQFVDNTLPPNVTFASMQHQFDELKAMFPMAETEKKKPAAKRPAKDDAAKPAKKTKAKKVASDDEADDAGPADDNEEVQMVEEAKANGTLNKLTVPVLKAYLKAKGKRVGGKKADLVAAIEGM